MRRPTFILPLIFGSGACALAYQVAWLRQFRLLFGASTAASAAVLAIFIGGLGIGSWVLGPRADKEKNPLLFYAKLEAGIALSAGLTPLLLWLSERSYLGLGGTTSLGLLGATILRLILAALVLLVPTFLMGGTLPAAARALEQEVSATRSSTALLYGTNTFGAVSGAFITNFVLLEHLGNRGALWLAALLNLAVAAAAFVASALIVSSSTPTLPTVVVREKRTKEPKRKTKRKSREVSLRSIDKGVVLVAASVVGFAFFLMEIVWYRVLSPLLGGTVFSMGLILAVALFGVAVGGLAYAFRPSGERPTLRSLSWTCVVEAICLVGPFAFGDDIALWAALLQDFAHIGFWGQVFGWSAIAGIVILPGAIVSGYQFPLLIALLGQGREGVGRDAGQAYAMNTLGAVVGSLSGGFGLMPLLGSRGCWSTVAVALVGLGLYTAWLHQAPRKFSLGLLGPIFGGASALLLIVAPGPSTFWRHSGIGIGRFSENNLASPRDIQDFKNWHRRALLWEKDGVESGVALVHHQGMAFVVNGKIDGHATLDAPTQIMSGLLGSLLHPDPKRSLVIGLGTGSTAGWLGQVSSMQRVDVVELEPAILDVARDCWQVNHNVLENPKVKVLIGDGRELLLTTDQKYDVVFSEPSNPYRAGIASFFTHEFYQATERVLTDDGILVQWIQAYEINPSAVELVYATLGETFPYVETWRTHRDLLLLATKRAPKRDPQVLLRRIAEEPYKSGLREAWQVNDLEGLFSYYVAEPAFAIALNHTFNRPLNTDNRNLLEFDFARSVGRSEFFSVKEALNLAQSQQQDRPLDLRENLNWGEVSSDRARLYSPSRRAMGQVPLDGSRRVSLASMLARAAGTPLTDATEANTLAEHLAPSSPDEAKIVLSDLAIYQKDPERALGLLTEVFMHHRVDPWIDPDIARRGLINLKGLASAHSEMKPAIIELLSHPFAARAVSDTRLTMMVEVTTEGEVSPQCVEAFAPFEPYVDWRRGFLVQRISCYESQSHPLLAKAKADLQRFDSMAATPFGEGLRQQSKLLN